MMLAQQLTDGCANHFRDAFSELALLQQQGMFCDITLFICEDIVATNVSRQATTDPDAAANTDSSTHDRPTDGNTEQATSGSIEAPVTSTELAQIQEFQNQREVNATPNPDSIALKHQLYQHDRTKTVGEERISFVRAHKVVLAACSKVLLSQMMQDLNATEMLVGATSHAALSAIIHYMYSGVLNLTPDSVEDIHERCRAWDMQMAVDMCEQFQKQIEQTVVRQVEIAATQQTTQQTETPPKRTRGRPPSSKSAAAVKEFVRTPRTRSASLRSASPMAVKEAPKKRGRKKDETKLIEEPVTEVADSRTGLSEAKHASGNVSLGNVSERDLGEKDVPDNDAEEEFLAEGVEVEREKVEEKSHAYSLRPEIKRRQDPDDATPAKTRKVCRNIVLENVLVIKGTRARKNVHYTKTPAEIGHIQKHGYHADYLDLSLFSDTSGKTKSEMFKSKSEVVPEGTGSKENSLAEKGPGAASIGCAQEGSSDVAGVGQMFLKDDNKRLQDTAIPEEVDSKKLGDKDHNYVVAQNDSLKQKGKQHGCRTCRRCHKRFRTKLQYHSHLDKCPVALACPRKHYHCRQCNVSFATHTEYHKHRRMHLEMSKLHKPYMCNQCDFKCRVETRLVEHMYRQHGFPLENSGFEVYVCSVEGCGYQSILRNVMKHHQTRHSQERPFMCEFCGMKFKSKVTLRTHTRIHTNERMFKCTYCDASYIQRVGLLNHIKSKHERTNEFLCSQCPFVTSLKPNLQNHMFTAHGILPSDKAKVYKCEHCGLKTLRKSEYTNHMRRHSGVKSFACDVCSHKFYTQAEINNHKKRHLNNPPKHTCPYESCNFAVFEKSKLQQHIRIRHTEKGLKPWTCYICDYRTDLKGNLTKHLRTVHHLVVQTNQKLCKVVSSTVATSSGQMLTPTTCVNVNDLHVSKMAQPVDELPRHPPPSDPIDVAVVPGGYLKVKECDIETVCVSPSIESQQHGLLVGGDINQVPVALMPDISRPLDTSNMRVIYSMTNLAGTSSGMPGDGSTDLVVMSSGVSNLPVSSLTNMSMSSPSLGTTTMPLTSLTPLPSISSSLGGLRHSSLALSLTASLPATSPVNVPYPQSLGGVPVTSNSDLMPLTTTTLTPLVTHIPPPTPHILPPAPAHMPATGQGQLPKDGSLGMLPILMPTDPNSGLYMYADNQLIPPQAMSWEHASQDITQYRQQAYK